jgi:pimeloyl-ACP methyl ester carboxylesterase
MMASMHILPLISLASLALIASAQSNARMRYTVRYENVTIAVIGEGRGPLIVLLPSLGRDSEEFDPVAKQIASAGFRVVRPQPRGYLTTGPLQNITLHDLAKDVAKVIEHENSGPAILAGHAFGHFVAKMTAVDYPKLTRGVVLIAASQKKADPEVQRSTAIASDVTQPAPERLVRLQRVFFAPGHDASIWLKWFHPDVQRSEVIARDATPQQAYWSAGTAPLLDIQAESDPYRPPSSRNELIEEFGAKRMTTLLIPNGAHAVIVEQPIAVGDAIIAWAKALPKL